MVPRNVHLAVSSALLNAVTVGIACTYTSTAVESMKTGKLNPNPLEISWIGSILPLGAIFGGLIAGYFSDKIGRKGVMMYLSLLLVGSWLLIAYATSLSYVYAGRFFTGFCAGIICVVTPMYIVELATPELRGNIGTRFQLFICLGIIITSTLGIFLPWTWVAISGAVIAVLAPLCMLPMPESPRWLAMKGKHADAVEAMHFLYGTNSDASVNALASETLNIEQKNNFSLMEIPQRTFYKPALLSISLMFFQQFCGSNAILFYTVSIFKQSHSAIDPVRGNTIVAFVMFAFTFLATVIMDVIGRKKSLYISGFVMCISLNAFSTYLYISAQNQSLKQNFGWIPLICLLVYIAAFSIGLGPIPWLMMSEMSPERSRGVICGLGTAFSWIFVFIVTKTFLQIESDVHDFGAYWMYSSFCFLACLFTFFFLPETKGKTPEEIESYFVGSESSLQRLEEAPGVPYIDLVS